ncbi:hypothetical protein SCUCBS95973_004060 [Sporothrix curviconia]|uniref:Carbohydrate esterase family 16 protein n=1 Tax=Sporothrix curviconia TaxID=1260050 RepID=A0ABP0BKI7_9PEZI
MPDIDNCNLAVASKAPLWPGWEGINTIFSFGDSYTTTGFVAAQGPQPDATHPLGTPQHQWQTSSNGPNWICYLTTDCNEAPIKTYNLACGGATVASRLIHRFNPKVLSLEQQVEDVFLPLYPAGNRWQPSSTLFALFLGINDVGLLYTDHEPSVYDEYLATYADLVLQLYNVGARSFLFLTVPSVDRSPLTTRQGPEASAKESVHIQYWNDGIARMADHLRQRPGTTVFVFDTRAPFSRVMDTQAAFPETAVYRDTTSFCPAYAGGTDQPDFSHPDWPLAANEYLWLNDLHPTYPVHQLWARLIAEQLKTGRSLM